MAVNYFNINGLPDNYGYRLDCFACPLCGPLLLQGFYQHIRVRYSCQLFRLKRMFKEKDIRKGQYPMKRDLIIQGIYQPLNNCSWFVTNVHFYITLLVVVTSEQLKPVLRLKLPVGRALGEPMQKGFFGAMIPYPWVMAIQTYGVEILRRLGSKGELRD